MAMFAIRRPNESNDAVQQRFKKQFQKLGLAKAVRGSSRFKKKDTKRLTRQKALKREEYRDQNRKKRFYSNM